MSETITISPNLDKIYGHGPTLEELLAELIDNSIKARTEKGVKIDITIANDEIRISDNGSGMDLNGLKNALTLGNWDKKGKRIKDGLVFSCIFLGRNYEIVTKKEGDEFEYSVIIDDKELVTKNGFELVYQMKKVKKDEHYTHIIIRNLRIKDSLKKINQVICNLEIRFSHYIENTNDNIAISINNTKLKATEIITIPESTIFLNDETSFGRITGWVSLRDGPCLKPGYGIHCYKNKKLIRPFNKIGFRPHPIFRRLYGKINIDFVPLTQNNKDFIIDSPEYKEVENLLAIRLRPLIRECEDRQPIY